MILCIDPGSRIIGYALMPDNCQNPQEIESGRIVTKTSHTLRERLYGLAQKVKSMMLVNDFTEIWIENTTFLSPGKGGYANMETIETLACIKTLIRAEAEEMGIPFQAVYPGTIKNAVTGSGNAKKPEVMAAVARLSGQPAMDDNQADAWGLAYTVIHRGNDLRLGKEERLLQKRAGKKAPKVGQVRLGV